MFQCTVFSREKENIFWLNDMTNTDKYDRST